MSPIVTSNTIASLRGPVQELLVVPVRGVESQLDDPPDQPFAEGAQDALDPDLRHRMISEGAYHRYVARGYADGYDLDDWLDAEAAVDHVLLNRTRPGPSPGA